MSYFFDLLLQWTLYGSLGLALLIPYVWGGRLVLCQSTWVGLGAYTVGFLTVRLDYALPVALLAAVLIGAVMGILLAATLGRLNDAAFALVTFLVALAGMEVFINATSITGGHLGIGGLPTLEMITTWSLPPKGVAASILAILCVVEIVALGRLRQEELGRAVRALRDDHLGAHLDGIDPRLLERDIYALWGGLSALVGGIWALALPRVIPEYFDVMILGLTVVLACIIGIGERPFAILIGAALVVSINEGAERLTVDPELRGKLPLLCVGVAYVLLVLFPPDRLLQRMWTTLQRLRRARMP